MSRDQQRLQDYLGHIRQAIARIERYTDNLTDWAFLANERIQDAVIRNFESSSRRVATSSATTRVALRLTRKWR
ncbi:HepT-like ribonuclease domain-containing protein [Ralstonia chuxiongensis]|uniref:HepT-like ribonuclease domain-containing protein n=1 Tax=Ralstonia chuxiongensis TaxID=2957504 RepID=UPI0028F5296B|nr:hypothetical protein [Ralstonia chuxiongensis]CAJ0780140.1 hypothetical protein R8510_04705 [Ralstonia chuxiongensis]